MILMKIVYFVLDKALSSYYSAMEEQVSIIIPIIVALLTGGFIILFLENQHVGASVIERYHFIMQPFMHRLSNYFKFLSSAKVYFSINRGTKKEDAEYVFLFNDLMDRLGRMAFPVLCLDRIIQCQNFQQNNCREFVRILIMYGTIGIIKGAI